MDRQSQRSYHKDANDLSDIVGFCEEQMRHPEQDRGINLSGNLSVSEFLDLSHHVYAGKRRESQGLSILPALRSDSFKLAFLFKMTFFSFPFV